MSNNKKGGIKTGGKGNEGNVTPFSKAFAFDSKKGQPNERPKIRKQFPSGDSKKPGQPFLRYPNDLGKPKKPLFKFNDSNRKTGLKPAKAKKGRMFLASTFRALDEAKEEKNYKKKDRIMQSGDKDRIKLMKSDLLRLGSGGDASCGCSSCMGESTKGAGAAVKGTNFKGVF